jgi:hypothetical protein
MRPTHARSRATTFSCRAAVISTALFFYFSAFTFSSLAASPPDKVTLIVKMAKGLTVSHAQTVLRGHGATPKAAVSQLDLHVIEVPAPAAEAITSALQHDAEVVRVEGDRTRKWQSVPSDTLYPSQWALPKIGWDQIYGVANPQYLTKVAILDTGVDATHPDLSGVVVPGRSLVDAGDGRTDENGHGTWLAGIVAARTDNLQGIAAVAYDHVQVMPVKVLTADGLGQDSDIIQGVTWAADNGASVILMAFSNPGFSEALQEAIDYAWGHNVVLVAAVGNDGSNTPTFPAGDRAVMGVSATDSSDTLVSGSNYGAAVFVAAPGTSIVGTYPGNTYVTWSGTSASAAIVAGTAALMRAINPSLSNGVVVGRIARNAGVAGTQVQTGNGRVDVSRALADTSTASVEPAGAPPVGTGGPFLGPYVIAANNDANIAPEWAAGSTATLFNTLYRVTTGGTVQHVRITLPAGYTSISAGATAFSSGTWSTPVVNQVNRTVDVSLASGTGLAVGGWARIDLTATTPPSQNSNAAKWLLQTFTNTAGTAGEQNDQPAVLVNDTTNPSAAITFVDGGGNPIANPVLQNNVSTTLRVRITQAGSGIKYVDVAVPTCFSSPTAVTTTVSTGGNGGYNPTVTDGFIRMPNGTIPSNGFLTVQFDTTPNCVSGTYTVSTSPGTNATNPPSGTNQSVSITGGSLTVVAGLADLSITKTDSPDPVTPSGTLTYTITVHNGGPDDASAVKVVDTLPAGTTFVSATGTNWSCTNASGTVTCNRTGGNLPANTDAPNITIVVTAPTSLGPITNTATVSSPNDNTSGNNTATATTAVKRLTTTSVTSSANPSVFGQSVTFTATVAGSGSGSGDPGSDGKVTFKADGTAICTDVALSANQATCATSSLAVGTHAITAEYHGGTNFQDSTGTLSPDQTVNKANTSTSVTSSPNPSTFGQSVTFTATVTVTSPGSGTLTGTVTFKEGTTTLGSGTLSAGQATFSTSSLPAGTHTITAEYSGNANFNTSTSTVSHVVNQADTSTSVTSSANPSVFGQSVTFTATVTAVAPGSGTPTGTATFKDGTTTLGTGTLDATGKATFTTSNLSVATHSITVEYGGDSNFKTSTSSALSQVVDQAHTSTTLTSSTNPSVYGQAVTFTATVTAVAPGSGTPTGSVTFKDGSTTLGTGTLDATGKATFTTSSLSVATHSITVEYAGDTNFKTSTSSALSQVVNQADTSTAVTSSANPSVYGQAVTFTATVTAVAPGSGTPTGTATFKDGSTTLGTGTLDATGKATFTTSTLSVAAHSITVAYGGDTNFKTSTSSALSQAVEQADTSTAVTSSVNPSVYGQSVTFTAAVSVVAPGAGTPTGTVTFKDGSTTLGTGTLDASGHATFTTVTLPAATHSITAVYGGDTNFKTSTSSALSQLVNPADTSTSLTSSLNPSTYGQSVTFTAVVSAVYPGTGVPTGTVTFKDGTTTLGSGTLNALGQATYTTTSLTAVTHSITAVYEATTNYKTSTSAPLSQVVNKADTSTTLTSSTNPSVFGQSVTFTATVTSSVGTPPGIVTFKDGTTTLGTGTLNASGVAVFSTASLSVTTHSITAEYGGDTNFNMSASAPLSQTVNKAATTTTVTSSANPSVFGQSVTFTATVTAVAPGAGIPTGTVTFKDGTTMLGTGTLNASGVATFATSSLSVAAHSITVEYNGDGNFNTSTSATLSQTVNRADTTTTVTSSANPSVVGQSVTFTATVAPVAPGAGIPGGAVTFKDASTTLGTATLDATGKATLSTSSLAVGTHSITVEYGGDTNFNSSVSGTLSQVVNKAPTSTTVTSSANPSVFGQSVTFTATVTVVAPGSGTPTGTVTFNDGMTAVGGGTLNSAGQATFTTSSLSVATHSITVVYSGDTNYLASTSGALSQVVNKGATTTSITSSPNPSIYGNSVTLTAAVNVVSPAAGTPTGTVQFFDGAAPLGTGSVNSSGIATFATSALTGGAHTLSAVYSGDGNFSTSTSPSLSHTVTPKETTTAVVSSLNPSTYGVSVTFTATVTGSIVAEGSITFKEGMTVLAGPTPVNASGQASFSTASLSGGTHTITADYSGTANYQASSGIVNQTVNRAATSTVVTSSVNPSVYGQSVTLTAAVSSTAGTPTGTVTFKDGSTVLGTGVLSGGLATFTTSTLAVGGHSIIAEYGGNTNFDTSASGALAQTVNKAATATTVTSSANPSVFGQTVTFTATVAAVSPGAGSPSGTVTFKDGTTVLGTVPLSGGAGTLSTSSLSVGSHPITVEYAGDTNFYPSVSGSLSQTVSRADTSTSLTSTANPSVFGQAVTFTATVVPVAPGAGIPSGTVTFKEGSTTLGIETLDSTGKATLAILSLAVGSHSIAAYYGGSTNYNGSTGSLLQTVNPATTATTLTSAANPSVFGQPVTFTATVSAVAPGTGTPTGTVTFNDGATLLTTATLNSSAQATFTVSNFAVATHSITVVYSGDTNYNGSTSAVLLQVVNKGGTTTSITSSPNPSTYGNSVLLTASVSVVSPAAGTPTGSVEFFDSATSLGTGSVNASGVATLTTSGLAGGSHTLKAIYSGDGNFSGSSSPNLAHTVSPKETTTTVTSNNNPSTYGQSVTFTATVAGSVVAEGSITFKDGVTVLAGPTPVNASGQASFSTSSLTGGSHIITAEYSGTGNYQASSGTVNQTVNRAATSSTVVSSVNPSLFGQPVTLTATVTSSAGTPTGAVTFKDGSTALGTGTLNASGIATFTTSTLAVGGHSITAEYGGDTNFNISTSVPVSQTVQKANTTTAVSSNNNPSNVGQSITFTAVATANTPGAGTPTGTVTFKEGATSLGTGVLNGSGQATFTTSALAVGPHSITAQYGADTNFNGSTSGPLGQIVNGPPVITNIIADPAAIPAGGTTTVTASFSDPNTADTHTCIASLKKDGVIQPGSPTTLVTEAGGSGTCKTTLALTAVGVYEVSITVKDGGGLSASAFTLVAVYDPSAGFVTGGGWITSPVYPSLLYMQVSGRANFGFVSKYKKGSSTPDGQTEFQFQAGSLNFHSVSYDWLVVSGAGSSKAQFKGRGTINGTGDYNFLLTGIDGDSLPGSSPDYRIDKFRIKIMNRNPDGTDATTVYDNQLGQSDSGDAATVLGGGSIQIQAK